MDTDYLKIALAQINPCVGDIRGNSDKIKQYIKKAVRQNCDIICFPELSITGYPPEDLLLNQSFISENINALNNLLKYTESITSIIGFVDSKNQNLYNSAAIINDGKLIDTYHKQRLPNYGVFDEKRYFESGNVIPIYKMGKIKFGVNICEDIWFPGMPSEAQSLAGAQFIVNISSSPFHALKAQQREDMLVRRAKDYNLGIVFCNLVGAQDELVFDGHSCAIFPHTNVVARASGFEEDFLMVDVSMKDLKRCSLKKKSPTRKLKKTETINYKVKTVNTGGSIVIKGKPLGDTKKIEFDDEKEEILKALVLGTRDYVKKNGFGKVVIGLSGGIDSSLVAVIAVLAIGPDNVVGISMPSKYSSKGSIRDAKTLAKNLEIKNIQIPINHIYDCYMKEFWNLFKDTAQDVTEENLQARIRGNILMAMSNKFGWLVLTTANKSETSVGYTTLYGDMAGGFSVIKDVPKTLVYKLANYYNDKSNKDVIPLGVINKAPSAELRPGQKDTDTLPPYDILDPILKYYVEEAKNLDEIVRAGFNRKLVKKIVQMVDGNEYKRRQAPPGIKITPRAFGRDRRFPLTNKYRY